MFTCCLHVPILQLCSGSPFVPDWAVVLAVDHAEADPVDDMDEITGDRLADGAVGTIDQLVEDADAEIAASPKSTAVESETAEEAAENIVDGGGAIDETMLGGDVDDTQPILNGHLIPQPPALPFCVVRGMAFLAPFRSLLHSAARPLKKGQQKTGTQKCGYFFPL